MRRVITLATSLIVLLAWSGPVLAQQNTQPPFAWHADPDLSPSPLGPLHGEKSVQYTLGYFTPNATLYPASRFPINLDAYGRAYITSNFGYRYLNGSYDEHFGVDLETGTGDPVRAINSGTVTVADTDNCGSAGRWVEIRHNNGWHSRYMHLNSVNVKVGDVVSAGTIIGTSGGSGFCSDTGYGDHLHLEIRRLRNGVYIPYDPLAFFTNYSSYRWDVYEGNGGYPYIPTQSRGSQGIWVYLLQDSLTWHGYSLSVDGIFGPQTEAVVKQFQTDQRIGVDGIVGPQTWAELMGEMD